MVGFCLAILIHFSGINTIIDYAPSIFRAAGWEIDAALFSTFIVGLTNFSLTIVSFWIIDRYGRRPSLHCRIVGHGGGAACFDGGGIEWALPRTDRPGPDSQLSGVFLLVYRASLLDARTRDFPNNIRGTAMTVPVLTQWVANALVVLFSPYAFNRIGKSGHVWISCDHGARAGSVYVVFRAGNQEHAAGRDRGLLDKADIRANACGCFHASKRDKEDAMAKGVITDADVEAYRKDGFVLVRGMLDGEEIGLLGRAAREDRVLDQHSFGRADGEGGTVRLSLWNHPTDTIYGMVARSESIVGSAEKILEGEVYHYHSKMIMKDPRVGGAWTWHESHVPFDALGSRISATNRRRSSRARFSMASTGVSRRRSRCSECWA